MFDRGLLGEVVAIANIESSSVSFSIAKLKASHHATILATRYAELPLEERSSGQHLFALKQRLADVGKAAIAEYTASHRAAIRKAYAIMHAPWAVGTVVRGSAEFPKETHISAAVIAECATKTLAAHTEQEGFLDVQQLPILLNGYRTASPEGKHAHSVEMAAVVSTVADDVRREISAIMQALTPVAHIFVHSGVRAVLGALEAVRPRLGNAVCLHVSGEGTEIIVMHDGIADRYAYVPEGLRTMLARAFPDMRPDDARAAVRHLGSKEGSDEKRAQTEGALLKAESEMARAFGEGFVGVSGELRLPNALVLIADTDIAPWLKTFFERIDFSQFTLTAQPFAVDVVAASEFGSVETGKEKNGDLDMAIATSHVLRTI